MTSHDWFIEQRTAFAARTLPTDEERLFADHLERCPECREAVARIEHDLGWLPMGVTPVAPRPGFRRRAAEAVLGSRRGRWLPWISLAAAAVVIVAAIATVDRASRRERAVADRLVESERALAALNDTVAILRHAARVLQASIAMGDHQGGLVIFADSVTHRWNVVLHGMPPAPEGQRYQFWFITAEGMVKSVDLWPEGGVPVFVTLGMPPRGGAVLGAALSIEPDSNQTDQPKGKQLAHLML